MCPIILHLLGKILYFFYSRTQAFLQSCTEAIEFSKVRFEFLAWDDDVYQICQGYGSIINMFTLPFITQHNNLGRVRQKFRNREQLNHSNNTQSNGNAAVLHIWNRFFYNGVGKHIVKAAFENKIYLP